MSSVVEVFPLTLRSTIKLTKTQLWLDFSRNNNNKMTSTKLSEDTWFLAHLKGYFAIIVTNLPSLVTPNKISSMDSKLLWQQLHVSCGNSKGVEHW